MVEIRTSYEDEERFINIGKINPKVYAVVTTIRGEKIRIIPARRARKKRLKSMKAEEFDKIFDDNKEDIVEYLDLSTFKRPNLEAKRINIDFPTWMVKKLDEEAQHIGVNRQAIIKTWLADKIMQIEHNKVAV